jgi:glutamine phosphoribosylpyrophosphate amidotransferase
MYLLIMGDKMDDRIERAVEAVVDAFDSGMTAAKDEARGDHVYYDFPISRARSEFREALVKLVELLVDDD